MLKGRPCSPLVWLWHPSGCYFYTYKRCTGCKLTMFLLEDVKEDKKKNLLVFLVLLTYSCRTLQACCLTFKQREELVRRWEEKEEKTSLILTHISISKSDVISIGYCAAVVNWPRQTAGTVPSQCHPCWCHGEQGAGPGDLRAKFCLPGKIILWLRTRVLTAAQSPVLTQLLYYLFLYLVLTHKSILLLLYFSQPVAIHSTTPRQTICFNVNRIVGGRILASPWLR